jgi:hypothetical protein
MQTSDIVQIIVAVITATGAIISALFGRRQEKRRTTVVAPPPAAKKASKWFVGMYICVALLAGNLGLFGWRTLKPASGPEVRITYPIDGTRVTQKEMVKGTSRGVPSTDVIWVLVFVHEVGRYYPQNAVADVQADGCWSSITYFGQAGDASLKFDVLAVLADQDGQDRFGAYLSRARDRTDYPGLARLPDGVKIYDRITVTRN